MSYKKSAEALQYLKIAARSCIAQYCSLAAAHPECEKPEFLLHLEKIQLPTSQEGDLNRGALLLLGQRHVLLRLAQQVAKKVRLMELEICQVERNETWKCGHSAETWLLLLTPAGYLHD